MTQRIKQIIFYIIFFLFVLTLTTMARTYDYDLWARLIAGMGFVQTGHVLKADFLSYAPVHIWYDHEWGSGVIFYLTQHFFGAAGLLILQAILVSLTFFVIAKVVELRGIKTTHAYNFLFYFFAMSSISYLLREPIRCQFFTFLFFAVFLYVLELARKDNNKPLFLIPFLMIVWNNLHGGCVAGLGLIVLYIIGEMLNKKNIKKYIYVLIFSFLALIINPWGIEYLKFLFKANTMERKYVMEWWGLFFPYNIHRYIKFKFLAALFLIIEAVFGIKNIKEKKFNPDWTKVLVLSATLILAIMHVKLIPFFVISASCFLYDDFYKAFNFLTKNIFNKIANFKDALVYAIILFFIISNLNAEAFKAHLAWQKYPFRSIEFVKMNHIKGNLLINFSFGSYAQYKLYPNNKVFMDGRYEEVYYDFMMPMMKKFFLANKGWDEVLKKFPPDIIIIEKYYPIYPVLKQQSQWKDVFESGAFSVFVKNKNARKQYKQPPEHIDYYEKTLFDTDVSFVLKSNHAK